MFCVFILWTSGVTLHFCAVYNNSFFLCSPFADFKLETLGDAAQIPRLASSLSACAQLNTLSAGQRTWALHRLRKLVTSEAGPVIDVPALFGYNLMYDQPLIKMKHAGSQRMSAVWTSALIMSIERGFYMCYHITIGVKFLINCLFRFKGFSIVFSLYRLLHRRLLENWSAVFLTLYEDNTNTKNRLFAEGSIFSTAISLKWVQRWYLHFVVWETRS